MSWQAYIDQSLLGTGAVKAAAIHGLDGNPWATSPGFAVTPAEAAKLVAGFTTADGLYSGIHISGVKFMFLRADPESIHGKQGGSAGVTIVKTDKAIIIGTYGEGQTAGQCSAVVGKLGDYLKGVGY